MTLEHWVTDAERLASALPDESPIISRVDYLLSKLMDGCIEVSSSVFSKRFFTVPTGTNLLVTRKDLLAQDTSKLSGIARRTQGIAFIAHGTGMPSLIALPKHDPNSPIGNGHILLHEIEHFTEAEEGIPRESTNIGMKERRAYRTNIRIMESLDGSDFRRYINDWPVTFETSTNGFRVSADILFHDEHCPEPPAETFTHELWHEGHQSQQILQSTGRMAMLEHVAAELSEELLDQLAGGLQLVG